MRLSAGDARLRPLEPRDLDALLAYRNDPEVADLLGGFSSGFSRADLADWLERHRSRADEILWAVVDAADDRCLGHVGLYRIDHRVGSAEFGILVGDASRRGAGLGRAIARTVIRYGFEALNLQRIEASMLATNAASIRMHEAVGFQREGLLRNAQYRRGRHVDVVVMGLLRPPVPAEG